MSGSTFFDALTNPGVGALMGLTQGFAQAAMPTRMPTPFGATLGMGAAGALQGAQTAQRLGVGQQQLEAAKIANQRSQMLLNFYNQTYGGGPGTVTPGNPNGPVAGGVGNSLGYLRSPQQLAQLADLQAAAGNDRSAATLYSLNQQTAGGPGYAMMADGTSRAVSGGPNDPRVVYQKEYATKSAGIGPAIATTAGNAAANAPYQPPVSLDVPIYDANGNQIGTRQTQMPLPQWAAQNGAGGGQPSAPPAGPSAGTAMPGSVFSQRIAASENGGGAPDARNPRSSATGNGQFIESTWLERFKQTFPQQAQGMSDQDILALRSNPQVSDAMIQANGATNNQALTAAGIPSNATTLALAHRFGPAGAATIMRSPLNAPLTGVLPQAVIAANPDLNNQTVGQLLGNTTMRFGIAPVQFGANYGGNVKLTPQAAASLEIETARQKAINDAAAANTRLIATRAGVFDPVTGKEIYRQPEYHETLDPNTGAEYPSFVRPNENGGLDIIGGPPSVQNGATPPTKLGPGQEDTIKHLADQYANEDKQKFEGATNSLFQLEQQDRNMQALNSAGWSSTGLGNNAKMEWAKAVNSVASTLGVQPLLDPTKVASWEDATKIQTQLAFAQAKQLGSREAQQVISMSRAATPGSENTEQGYRAISGGYHEMNNREIDLYNFKTQWMQNHGGNLVGAETAFNNQFTPKMYAERAISTVHPPEIQANTLPEAQQKFQNFLPGTLVKLNGQLKAVPARPDAPPVPGYMTQYIQPQVATNG